MDMDGGMRGGRAKRDSDRARSYKEHKRKSGVRTDSRVTVEAAPRARTTDFGKGGVAAQIRAQGTPKAYGKVGNAMMQENNPKKVSQMNGEDITQFNIRSFYDHSRRRRTTLAKYIFLLQITKTVSRANTLFKNGGKKDINQPRTK